MTPLRAICLGSLASLLSLGCAHRGLGFPGPTAAMGGEPVPYAERMAPEPDEDEDDAADEGWAGVNEDEAADDDAAEDAAIARRWKRAGNGAHVARAAASFVDKSRLVVRGDRHRWDCSGLVMAAHDKAGAPVSGNSASLYALAKREGLLHKKRKPKVGDIAFFDNTYDRNKNGRRDDRLTHVAVVEAVANDGTVTLVHKGSKGVVRITMNARRPNERTDEAGRVLNDYLRASRDKDSGPVLAGALWVGFGSLWALDGAVSDAD